jgi:hypothetical protein
VASYSNGIGAETPHSWTHQADDETEVFERARELSATSYPSEFFPRRPVGRIPLGKVILCTLGFLLVVGAASKNSSTSSTQTATTQYRSQYETDLPSDNQRYPSGVVPTYHDKGVAAVLIYDTECSSVTPSIPPVMVRYAYLHAQDRIAEVNAVRQEFEQVVTTGGMKRSTGVKFWCSQMWQEMGASWSKFK